MESNVPQTLVGYLAAAATAGFVAWGEWARLLMVWGPVVTVVCIVRLSISLSLTRRPPRPMGPGTERFLMVATAIVSVTMASAPVWITLHSQGFTSALMIALIVSTLWGGALVQAPVFSSAVSFSCAAIPVWLIYLGVADVTEAQLILALLIFVTTAIALDNVKRYASSFESGLRQQFALQRQSDQVRQQAEVIALLLKEHEDQSSDWLWQCDGAGRLIRPSERFAEVFSDLGHPLDGTSLIDILQAPEVPGNDEALARIGEHVSAARSFRDIVVPGMLGGRPRWWSVSGRPAHDAEGGVTGYRGVMGDVTITKEAQAHVDFLAHHDGLTGLANRAHFNTRVRTDLQLRGERSVGLISIDLDGFKPVNDRYGHPVGDELLIAVGRRLRELASTRGVAARLGGDEFAIVTTGLDVVGLQALCRRLLEALCTTFRIGPHDIGIGASIGVAVAPADGDDVDELLKNADAALYRAKRDGRGQYRFFEPEMDRQIQLRTLLLQDLREAVRSAQLVLHYQPYVDSGSGQVTGCEALLRWPHPTRGMISPAEFVPLAEESGLITEIGKQVIEQACIAAVHWPDGIRVSVNVSPKQFKDSTLPAYIEDVLRRTGLPPHRLEIEVTEAVLIDDASVALEILRRIRAIGVKLSLDDFGTGYSSLSYLRDFPFDKVKIDRSFVRDIEQRHDSQVIVQGIRSIALGLGMTITAEGVETPGQAERLRISGCHELQGFLFSKAQPETEVPDLLKQRHVLYGPGERDTTERVEVAVLDS